MAVLRTPSTRGLSDQEAELSTATKFAGGSRTPDEQAYVGKAIQEILQTVLADERVLVSRFLPDTTRTFVNRALAALYGSTPDQMTGKRFIDFVPEDERPRVLANLRAFTPERSVAIIEHPLVIPGERTYWIRWTNRANFDEDGRLVDFSAFGQDITAQKLAEIERDRTNQQLKEAYERLAESERRYNALCDSAPVGIYHTELDGTVTYVNDEYQRITGLTPEELKSIRGFVAAPPASRERLREAWNVLRNQRQPILVDFEYRHPKSGELRWLSTQARPLLSEGGNLLGFVGTLVDITERIQYQANLRKAAHRAELANRSKDQFLATMSHELRTPLNAIIGFSEMLGGGIAGSLTPKQDEYVSDILNSGRHLHDLISDLLDISRIESGKMELTPEPCRLQDLFAAAQRMVLEKAKAARVDVRGSGLAGAPEMMLDTRAFKQIFVNLLSNSLKFTPAGGRVVAAFADQADGFRLSITDTGSGIAPEDLPRVTNPFYQADSDTTRRNAGAGLGLYIVKSLVEAHGGQVEIDSRLGEGTTVAILLPRRLAEPQAGSASV